MPGSGANPYFADIPDVLPEEPSRLVGVPPLDVWVRLHGEPETRLRAQAKRAVALGVCLLWAVAQLVALGIRPDLAALPVLYVFATLVVPFALGVSALALALVRGRLGLGAPPGVVALAAAAGSVAMIGVGLALPEPHAHAATHWRSIFLCANLAVAWAAFPLIGAALTLRRAFASAPAARSALVGAAIGIGACVAAQLRCPVADSIHVASAHGGVVLVAALAGALLLARVTRV